MDEIALRSAQENSTKNYYAILARTVATVSQDQVHVRRLVYDFARRRLRKSLHRQFEEGDWSRIERQLGALETAIDRVEAEWADKPPPLTFAPQPPLSYHPASDTAVELNSQNGAATNGGRLSLPPLSSSHQNEQPLWLSRLRREDDSFVPLVPNAHIPAPATFWWIAQLGLAVLLGAAMFAAAEGRFAFGLLAPRAPEHAVNIIVADSKSRDANIAPEGPARAAKAPQPSMPVPSEYGAFALVNGQLTELEQLAMKAPDQRVAISPAISAPSRTHLPAGKLEFVIFRRDLANSAPDRIALRVVAKVVRALTFDANGKPIGARVDDTWVVRSNSHPMRVAPLADNPEMIVVRPDPPDFVPPAGRYVLVLKGVAYDFTLDGPATDPAHCLERTDALNAPVYTECRDL